ncbi:MAG TPA: beta-ketoacyl-[acyl-carrier-protein] synthase family protein [Candidatus Acidoferrales bacterium]|nr:beta-ketoacyl-[acyl-carrier-protein] synthase family protein [Candidatus Acidoferrales bacterium]
MAKRVVVTGLGVATPLGLRVEENWTKALAGISGIRRFNAAGAASSPVGAVGSVVETDWREVASEFVEEAETEGERRTLFALWAARRALEDAGFPEPAPRERFGVVLAAGAGIANLEDVHRWLSSDGRFDVFRFGRECERAQRDSILRNLPQRAASLIARRFDLRGLNCTVTTACASATQALGLAFRSVQRGEADVVLAGGADSMINPVGLASFVVLQAAARGSEDPERLCRPFDRRRSGLVVGEGAGIAVLEEEEHARRRGARVYAEVAGYGSSLDAHQVTAPHPDGQGAALAMQRAIRDAGLSPDQIHYINAHGTGTKLNDVAETTAIKRVFGDAAAKTPISSTKSLIGHLMAAAGGPEFVFTVLSVERDEIHPTVNLTAPDPKCDLDYVPNVKRSRTVFAALSNSFGFGGQNACIVVKKHRARPEAGRV